MKRAIVLCLGGVALGGCAMGAAQCLRTPVSSKISSAAVAVCGQAFEANLDRRDVFFRYVEILRVRGDFTGIQRAARAVRKHDLTRADAVYYMAYALRKRGKYALALRYYQAFSKANAKDADPHYGAALCHEGLGNRADAIAAYRAYLSLERRDDQRVWRKRAAERVRALGGGGPLGAPLPVARAAAVTPRRAPMSAPPKRAGARVVAPRPAAPKAVAPKPAADCAVHQRAIAADPFATAAYEKFAACAAAAGRYDDVVRKMRIALRDNPGFGRGWLHLGKAQVALKQAAAAKASFGKACAAGVISACGR